MLQQRFLYTAHNRLPMYIHSNMEGPCPYYPGLNSGLYFPTPVFLLAAFCKPVTSLCLASWSLPPFALPLGRWHAASNLLAAAVFEFTILRDGKLGGVCGGDAIADLHAVPLLHLRQGTHQPRVG